MELGMELFDEDDEYCVKIGTYVPGGCDVLVCKDIDSCPYRPKEVDLYVEIKPKEKT